MFVTSLFANKGVLFLDFENDTSIFSINPLVAFVIFLLPTCVKFKLWIKGTEPTMYTTKLFGFKIVFNLSFIDFPLLVLS